MGHALMENRHGLIVDSRVSEATGTAERNAAEVMVAGIPGRHRITVGGDKNFDAKGFVAALQQLNATPHIAQNTNNRRSAIDRRTICHPGYAVIQRIRKRIEEGFGWIQEVALQRRARHRGKDRVSWQFTLESAGLQPDPAAKVADVVMVGSPAPALPPSQLPRVGHPRPSRRPSSHRRRHPPSLVAISAACYQPLDPLVAADVAYDRYGNWCSEGRCGILCRNWLGRSVHNWLSDQRSHGKSSAGDGLPHDQDRGIFGRWRLKGVGAAIDMGNPTAPGRAPMGIAIATRLIVRG
jgi:hypothetical protein